MAARQLVQLALQAARALRGGQLLSKGGIAPRRIHWRVNHPGRYVQPQHLCQFFCAVTCADAWADDRCCWLTAQVGEHGEVGLLASWETGEAGVLSARQLQPRQQHLQGQGGAILGQGAAACRHLPSGR